MCAKGMTTQQISDILQDIYGFEASESFISDVTKKLPHIKDWQNCSLAEAYLVLYIDAIHYSVRDMAHPEAGCLCYFEDQSGRAKRSFDDSSR